MGLKNATQFYDTLRKAAPDAFRDVKTKEEEEAFFATKRGKSDVGQLHNFLRKFEPSADVVCIDLAGQDRSLMAHKECGQAILISLQDKLNRTLRATRARYIVICVDNKRHVPPAKQREQSNRRQRGVAPYTDDLVLSNGVAIGDPAEYEFGDDLPLPGDYQRLARTSILMTRFYEFVVRFLFERYIPDSTEPVTVIVSGARRPDSDQERTLVAHHDPENGVRRFDDNPVPIGEGECLAVYWLLRLLATEQDAKTGYVWINDSDGAMALLLNVPRILHLSPEATVWFNYTAPQTNERYLEVCDVWRGVSRWTHENVVRPNHQHDPVGALLLAFLLGGCDYVQPIAGHGPSYMVRAYMSQPKWLAGSTKRRPSATVVGVERSSFAPSMFIAANKVHDLVWHGLRLHSAFKKMLSDVGEHKLVCMRLPERFDFCAKQVHKYNEKVDVARQRAAEYNKTLPKGKKKRSAPLRAPICPKYTELRALVRRSLWALDYYRNAPLGAYIPGSEAFELKAQSVYGFRLNQEDRCIDADTIVSTDAFPQPFIDRLAQTLGKRKRDEEKDIEHTKRRGMIGRPTICHSDTELDEMANVITHPYGSFVRNSGELRNLCALYANYVASPMHAENE